MIKKILVIALLSFSTLFLYACENSVSIEDEIKEFAYYRTVHSHNDYTGILSRSVSKFTGELWLLDTDEYIEYAGFSSHVYYESKHGIIKFGRLENGVLPYDGERVYLIKVTKKLRDILYVYPFEVKEIKLLRD